MSDYEGVNEVTIPNSTNQTLPAGKSHFIPVNDRSNRALGLDLINLDSPLSDPSQANPLGRQSS